MINIGIRIKELRKKKDMTQEKLAEYLNVSFQAVSKWETGVASPDLSMIVPLARLLGVSTDELLGVSEENFDTRQNELQALYDETWETGDTAKRYEVAQSAVNEYPGNFYYLLWLAEAESTFATHNFENGLPEQTMHFENAVKYFEMIIEDCNDTDIRNDALYGIVLNLPILGRHEEAEKYARQHPDSDELLLWCLKGENKEKQRQILIERSLYNLVSKLEFGQSDLPSIQAAEKIIKVICDDGNYLFMNEILLFNSYLQAVCLTRDGRYDEAIEKMRECHYYAIEGDKMHELAKEKPLNYTCHILSKLSFDGKEYIKSGTESQLDNFREVLRRDRLAPLRERDDYKELLEL